MAARDPIAKLTTHEVVNQPPPLEDYDLFSSDPGLGAALDRNGGGWARERCQRLGTRVGRPDAIQWGHEANRFDPQLRTFDRYGRRVDEVDFHPAYHHLMELAIEHELPTLPWRERRPGAHVAHAALSYLFTQAETGVMCPMAMTYAVVPALRHQPDVAALWEPRILDGSYDSRCLPASEKRGVTFGMAMTEKQGGSDVRSNTTRAEPMGARGPGHEYLLTGHKWFCSAPMSDAFLTLAQSEGGLSCFLVPRWRPDGTRNNFFIQRLKDKLGNRSNASSEVEYVDTWAQMVGEEGRGVRTIIDMVHHTRLDAAVAPAAIMRQAVVQAVHHSSYRRAFGKRLIEQPLMRNVLSDLILEVEAATTMAMRVARAFDEGPSDPQAAAFGRLATAVSKYWLNKRAPGHVVEALECLGGAGYVEESSMPRLYREAPLNGIWEGSGNVICLDVLRAIGRDPDCLEAVLEEVRPAASEPAIGSGLRRLEALLRDPDSLPPQARRLTELLAKLLQASLLLRHETSLGELYCRARLGADTAQAYGTLPPGAASDDIIARAQPLPP